MPRMRILSATEQATFDEPPAFDHRDRKKFLTASKTILDVARSIRNPHHRIGFLLMCGYFRATRRFFTSGDYDPRDVGYAAGQLGLDVAPPLSYPDRTRQRHQRRVLGLYGFAPFYQDSETALATEISTMARMHLKPRLIFDRCVDYLIQRRVQVPRSGVLLELIRSGLQAHKAELIKQMDECLTDDARALLDELFTAPDDQNRYRLTLLKKLSQSTKPTKIKEAVADYETLTGLHDRLRGTLEALDLGVAGIRYYAGSVLRSEVFQIQRRTAADRHIHAAAFVAHQFYRTQENLIDLWLSVMGAFQARVSSEQNERLLENRAAQQAARLS